MSVWNSRECTNVEWAKESRVLRLSNTTPSYTIDRKRVFAIQY